MENECSSTSDKQKCCNSHLPVTSASSRGHLHCLMQLEDKSYREIDVSLAINNRHIEVAKYLIESGVPLIDKFIRDAISIASLELLQYLHSIDCPEYADSLILSAMRGDVGIMKYLLNKFECNEYITLVTVANGNIECLRYLVESGYPFNKSDCMKVAEINKHTECIEYLWDK